MAADRQEWRTPQQVVQSEMDSLRGRLLGAIESAGLPERQEIALKTLLKGQTYQIQWLMEEIVNVLDGDDLARFRVGPQLEMIRRSPHDHSEHVAAARV